MGCYHVSKFALKAKVKVSAMRSVINGIFLQHYKSGSAIRGYPSKLMYKGDHDLCIFDER